MSDATHTNDHLSQDELIDIGEQIVRRGGFLDSYRITANAWLELYNSDFEDEEGNVRLAPQGLIWYRVSDDAEWREAAPMRIQGRRWLDAEENRGVLLDVIEAAIPSGETDYNTARAFSRDLAADLALDDIRVRLNQPRHGNQTISAWHLHRPDQVEIFMIHALELSQGSVRALAQEIRARLSLRGDPG